MRNRNYKKIHSKFRSFLIYPEILKEFEITANQYMVYESIRYLSTHNPDFKWCLTPNKDIADFVCMSKRGVDKIIVKGLNREFLEKNAEGYGIRTTLKWNDTIIFTKQSARNDVPNKRTKFLNEEQRSLNKVSNKVRDNEIHSNLKKFREMKDKAIQKMTIPSKIRTDAQEEVSRMGRK